MYIYTKQRPMPIRESSGLSGLSGVFGLGATQTQGRQQRRPQGQQGQRPQGQRQPSQQQQGQRQQGQRQQQPQTAQRRTQAQAPAVVQDRYTPARNIDPATGMPVSTQQHPAPWAVVDVNLQHVNCRFYENAPREMVLPETLPYTMEISLPGYDFIGACHPSLECPAEIHGGARPGDPVREGRCSQWLTQWIDESADLIGSEPFRQELTEKVLDTAMITGYRRSFVQPAEFLEIIYEREARERPIRLFSFVVLATSAGILTFQAVRDAVKKRAKKKRKVKKKKTKKRTKK